MGFLLLSQHPPLSITTLMPASVPKFPGYPKYKASGMQKVFSIHGQKTTQFLSSKWLADNLRSRPINFFLSGSLALALSLAGVGIAEGKVGVNKPELLPKEFTPVIDVAGFLSDGQENRLAQEIAAIEKDTRFKLRVLAQNYPDTPGLAIKDFWKVDDRTIVFVADPTFGNILNFNVGASVDIDVPRSFWGRLAGKYGNMFYWKEKGEDASIEAAVVAIGNCLREPNNIVDEVAARIGAAVRREHAKEEEVKRGCKAIDRRYVRNYLFAIGSLIGKGLIGAIIVFLEK